MNKGKHYRKKTVLRKNLFPEEIKRKYTAVAWKEAAGFRDILIHEYFGIDLEAVWDTVRVNIPEFKAQIVRVLEAERSGIGKGRDD